MKQIGKIEKVKFGYIDCYRQFFGIHIEISTSEESEFNHVSMDGFLPRIGDCEKECVRFMSYICNLLLEAEVDTVDELVGTPVEFTFNKDTHFHDFCVLKEDKK